MLRVRALLFICLLSLLAYPAGARFIGNGGVIGTVPSPPGGTATWDPAFVGSNLSLSNGNLTATAGSSSSYGSTRDTVSATGDLRYAEFTINTVAGAYGQAVGVCNTSSGVNDQIGGAGTSSNSVGAFNTGEIYINNIKKQDFNEFFNGDVVREATNVNTQQAWFATNTGYWNNNPQANPVTGQYGVDISALGTGALYACSSQASSNALTADFGTTSYAFPLTGAINWGATPTTVTAHLTAGPAMVPSGDPVLLTWTSTNATSGCSGTGFSTGSAQGGTVTVNPSTTTTYQVSCSGGLGTAMASATATISSGTTYFVANAGNDSNNGTSTGTPWQTIGKVNSGSYNPGDQIKFNGGDNFTDVCLNPNPSNVTATSKLNTPVTFTSYGTGNATITSNCVGDYHGAVLMEANAITLKQITLRPGAGNQPRGGVFIFNTSLVPIGGITVDTVDVGGFTFFATSGSTNYGAEVFISGFPGNSPCALDGVTVKNSTLHGLSGASSPDENGISGNGSGRNICNVVYEGNTVFNIGANGTTIAPGSFGSGILAIEITNGTVQHNLVHDVGGNTTTCGGPVGIWGDDVENLVIQYNEDYHVQPVSFTTGCDWDGYDLDGEVHDSTVQYNYSHDNYGPGYIAFIAENGSETWGNNTFRYNISEHDVAAGTDTTVGAFNLSGNFLTPTGGNLNIYNNTFYVNTTGAGVRPSGFAGFGTCDVPGVVANNIFAVAQDDQGITPFVHLSACTNAQTWKNNDYYALSGGTVNWIANSTYTSLSAWQAATTGGDTNATTANPSLASGGSGGTCSWTPSALSGPQPCPSGYELNHGSAMIGAGLDLTGSPYSLSVGSTDYYLDTIPNGGAGTGYNIGTDGANR